MLLRQSRLHLHIAEIIHHRLIRLSLIYWTRYNNHSTGSRSLARCLLRWLRRRTPMYRWQWLRCRIPMRLLQRLLGHHQRGILPKLHFLPLFWRHHRRQPQSSLRNERLPLFLNMAGRRRLLQLPTHRHVHLSPRPQPLQRHLCIISRWQRKLEGRFPRPLVTTWRWTRR